MFPNQLDNIKRYEDTLQKKIKYIKDGAPPFYILIGGAWSAGKSTLSIKLANIFNISNIIHLDTVRAVLRSMQQHTSLLRHSTYNAWKLNSPSFSVQSLKKGIWKQSLILKPSLMRCLKEAEDFGKLTIVEGILLIPSVYSELCNKKNVAFFCLTYGNQEFRTLVEKRCNSTYLNRDASKYLMEPSKDAILSLNNLISQDALANGVPVIDIGTNDLMGKVCDYICNTITNNYLD